VIFLLRRILNIVPREKLRTLGKDGPVATKQRVVTRFCRSSRNFFPLWIGRAVERRKGRGAAGA